MDFVKNMLSGSDHGTLGEEISSPDIFRKEKTKSVIYFCEDLWKLQQSYCGQDQGFSLSLYKLKESKEVL